MLVSLDESEQAALEIREAQEPLERALCGFAFERLGDGASDETFEAFEAFRLDDPITIDEKDAQEPGLFSTWFLYAWIRDWNGTRNTIARAFAEFAGEELPDAAHGFLDLIVDTPHSFFEVAHVTPGRRIELRDLFLDTRHDVIERTASHALRKGEIIYARVLPLSGFSLLMGGGAIPLPAAEKPTILACRDELRGLFGTLSSFALLGSSDTLRGTYLEMRRRRLQSATDKPR
jgi:hypothetical protein